MSTRTARLDRAYPLTNLFFCVSGVLGLLGTLLYWPGAAAEVKNSLVGYCGSDSKCRDYKDWSQVLYDPANKTAGYMGSCDVCEISRPLALWVCTLTLRLARLLQLPFGVVIEPLLGCQWLR